MHLRNKRVQEFIAALRQSGHFVLVLKPGQLEGLPRDAVEQRLQQTIEEMKQERSIE